MSNLEKVVVGALGGLAAVLVKFLGQDFSTVVSNATNLTADQIFEYQIGYALLTPILVFLGGLVAWVSEEEKRMKLMALAIAAPALITTWSGGYKDAASVVYLDSVISVAHAGPTVANASEMKPENPDVLTEKDSWQRIKGGIGAFFGFRKEPTKYWVIVGSFKDRVKAETYAEKISQETDDFHAWVGLKSKRNGYYPVIVGGYNYLSEARVLKEKALATESITEAYLSSGKN